MLNFPEHRGGAVTRPRIARIASITGLLVCCAPVFALVTNGWPNAVLYVGALLAAWLLLCGAVEPVPRSDGQRRWMLAMVFALAAPIAATFISAVLRGDFHVRQFDSPSRFLLAIPVFLFVLRSRLPAGRVMQWLLPVALVLAFAYLELAGPDPRWPSDRHTTRALDPLAFGYLTLAFGLMCLVSIQPGEWRSGSRAGVLLRVACAALGVYLSVRSGSRSGWLALPIVLGIWLHHHWGRGRRLATAGAFVVAALIPLAAYLLVPAIGARIDAGIADLHAFSWDQPVEKTSSIGMRLNYLRIAADVFVLHPVAGIGDLARASIESLGPFPYASPPALAGAFGSGFHNQIVSNAIRTGIPGLVATAALLFVPLLVCIQGVRVCRPGEGGNALMGLAFCTTLVVSSMTTEVVDLKTAAGLYAVMVAVLCGAVLGERRPGAG